MSQNQNTGIDAPMRRNEKEITDIKEIEAVIRNATVCRLGMTDGRFPYVVPLCFGYREKVLYFHSAIKGKKMGLLSKNPEVCVEFDELKAVKEAQDACDWGVEFRSVIAFGRAVIIEDPGDKAKGLDTIMQNYSNRSFSYDAATLRKTAVIRVDISTMTGKQS